MWLTSRDSGWTSILNAISDFFVTRANLCTFIVCELGIRRFDIGLEVTKDLMVS